LKNNKNKMVSIKTKKHIEITNVGNTTITHELMFIEASIAEEANHWKFKNARISVGLLAILQSSPNYSVTLGSASLKQNGTSPIGLILDEDLNGNSIFFEDSGNSVSMLFVGFSS
jgi:hypothetical protein